MLNRAVHSVVGVYGEPCEDLSVDSFYRDIMKTVVKRSPPVKLKERFSSPLFQNITLKAVGT